jgi:hypothetical protein
MLQGRFCLRGAGGIFPYVYFFLSLRKVFFILKGSFVRNLQTQKNPLRAIRKGLDAYTRWFMYQAVAAVTVLLSLLGVGLILRLRRLSAEQVCKQLYKGFDQNIFYHYSFVLMPLLSLLHPFGFRIDL